MAGSANKPNPVLLFSYLK